MKRSFPFSEESTTEDGTETAKPFIFCDTCEGEDIPAHFFCTQCNKYYCKDCEADFHSRGNFSKHNRRLIPSNFGRLNCISHIDSPITLFCLDDNGNTIILHTQLKFNFTFNFRNDMHRMPRQRQSQRPPRHRL